LRQVTTNLDSIVDNLLLLFPLFYRKLIRVIHTSTGSNPINMEYHVTAMLASEGELPISVIGNRLGIARPNMTSLVDKLIAQGYCRRLHDDTDRRIVNISVTEKGKQLLATRRRIVRGNMKKQLEYLGEVELDTLCQSLENVRQIIAKMGTEQN
jgi:DNA-binding MarR family transcriptional regulator